MSVAVMEKKSGKPKVQHPSPAEATYDRHREQILEMRRAIQVHATKELRQQAMINLLCGQLQTMKYNGSSIQDVMVMMGHFIDNAGTLESAIEGV